MAGAIATTSVYPTIDTPFVALEVKNPHYEGIPHEYVELSIEGRIDPKTSTSTALMIEMILEELPPVFVEIAREESHLNPSAINDNPKTRDYSIGLFQINLYGNLAKDRPSEEWLLIPENNIQYAKKLYEEGGFAHWTVCKTKVKCYDQDR